MSKNTKQERPAPFDGLRLKNHIVNADNGDCTLAFAFPMIGGGEGSQEIPRSHLERPSEILSALLAKGWNVTHGHGAALEFVKAVTHARDQPPVLRRTSRHGWHGPDTYVHQAWTAGPTASTLSMEAIAADEAIARSAGTLEGWRDGLREPCECSLILILGIASAFAGPLMDLLGIQEGVTFNFHGVSSAGKSLTLRCSVSAYGRAHANDLQTYDITDAGLDDLCCRRSDLCVILDEQGRASGGLKKISDIAFRIAGGVGRARHHSVHQTLREDHWRVIGLTSGETPLDPSRNGGEQLRHIDVPVPPKSEGGIFLTDGDLNLSARLALQTEATITANYGRALQPYVEWLIANRAQAQQRAQMLFDRFVERVGATDSWDRRFAAKFALLYAAVDLAAEAGVAPWSRNEGRKAIWQVYGLARGHVPELVSGWQKLREAVQAAQSSGLIPSVKNGEVMPHAAVGFLRASSKNGPFIALRTSWVTQQLASASHIDAVRNELRASNLFVEDEKKGGLQLKVKESSGPTRVRWFCVRTEALT